MSLGIVISCPEGVVLAADTRLTLTRNKISVYFDNSSKLLHIGPKVAAVMYGTAMIGARPMHTLVPEFKREVRRLANDNGAILRPDEDPSLSVEEYAERLASFLRRKWDQTYPGVPPSTSLLVGGISPQQQYGEVYNIENLADPTKSLGLSFGMTWGGQLAAVTRLAFGVDSTFLAHLKLQLPGEIIDQQYQEWQNKRALRLPYGSMPLQDCVNLAILMVDTTIKLQALSEPDRGVGGSIEVVAITPEGGTQWLRRRKLSGGK